MLRLLVMTVKRKFEKHGCYWFNWSRKELIAKYFVWDEERISC